MVVSLSSAWLGTVSVNVTPLALRAVIVPPERGISALTARATSGTGAALMTFADTFEFHRPVEVNL